jgi:hypothetical protein
MSETPNFKNGFIDRVRGLVNGDGCKVLLVKEQYLVDQFIRLGTEFLLETQAYIIVVKDFDDLKELDEKEMEKAGWVRAETKPKIHLL